MICQFVCRIVIVMLGYSLSISLIMAAPLGKAVTFESLDHLSNVFDRLSELETGGPELVRFTHVGDSHIIADFWTGHHRQFFQKTFGDGGRGFVLSGKAWRSYSQQHIRHKTDGTWKSSNLKKGDDDAWFGPGGCYMESNQASDSLEIYTKEGGVSSHFDQLDVLTFGHPQGGRYHLFVDEVPYQAWSTFNPWLSIKKHRFSLSDSHHKIRITPQANTGKIRVFGVSMTRSKGGVVYDSIGLNGAQALHLLKNHNDALIQSFEALDPQLMIISFGINELFDRGWDLATYEKHFDTVLAQLTQIKSSNCLITGPFVALRKGRPLADMPHIYRVQRDLAKKYKCAFWNTHHAMGDGLKAWQRKGWARKDGVHLSRHGYARIGELFEKSFMQSFQEWKSKKRVTQQSVNHSKPKESSDHVEALPSINKQAKSVFDGKHSQNKRRLQRARPSLKPSPFAQKNTIKNSEQ